MRQLGWPAFAAAVATVILVACQPKVIYSDDDDGSGGSAPSPTPTPTPTPDPESCADYSYFECGFEAHCSGDTIVASWHEHHIDAQGNDNIVGFSCTYLCPIDCASDYSDWPQSGSELIAGMCTEGGGGSGGEAGAPPCPSPPSYSDDCSEVPYFQCGFEAHCEGDSIVASWHEHVMCGDTEEIYGYECSYDCATSCDGDYLDWPEDGTALVDGMCLPGEGGSGGAGGAESGGYGGFDSAS